MFQLWSNENLSERVIHEWSLVTKLLRFLNGKHSNLSRNLIKLLFFQRNTNPFKALQRRKTQLHDLNISEFVEKIWSFEDTSFTAWGTNRAETHCPSWYFRGWQTLWPIKEVLNIFRRLVYKLEFGNPKMSVQ